MKYIVLFLALVSSLFATTMTSQEFINAMNSSNMTLTDCIIFSDLNNYSLCGYNNTINITTYVNNQTYCYEIGLINASEPISLSYGESARNVSCPTFPKINENIVLSGNSSKTYPAYNLSISSIIQLKNTSNKLSCSQTYTTERNETFYTDTCFNQNIKVETCGFSWENNTFGNFKIYTEDCSNNLIRLDYDQEKKCEFTNTTYIGQERIVETAVLGQNESKTWEDVGKTCLCQADVQKYVDFCINNGLDGNLQAFPQLNMSNYTCDSWRYTCVSNLTQSCSMQEKFVDENGVIVCVNRIVQSSLESTKKYQDDYTIMKTERDKCVAGTLELADTTEDIKSLPLSLVLGAVAFVLIALLAINIMKKRGEPSGGYRG